MLNKSFIRSALEQEILVDPISNETKLKTAPKFNLKPRPKSRRKPCELSPYTVKLEDLPIELSQAISEYEAYLTEEYYAGRIKRGIRDTTCSFHRKALLEMLGWLHNYCDVPLSALSLNLLVEPADLNDAKAAQEAANDFRALMHQLWLFMQGRGNSAGTMVKKLQILTRLVQYQYLGQYSNRHGNDIPTMQVVRELLERYQEYQRDELDPIPIEGKWLELEELIQKVTMPSFAATEFRTRNKALRSQAAIASSFQEALLWSLFSLMPPRRPGEWRTCKLAMCCDLSQRPLDLQPGDWIWPLPLNRNDKEELKYGYLTRQYIYQDPVTLERFGTYLGSQPPAGRHLVRVALWFKDTPRQAAKSGDSHGHQKILVMDRQVYRNKHLYDFLEAYLMGYWRDRYGNWVSLGQSEEAPHQGFSFYSLRSSIAADPLDSNPSGSVLSPVWLFVGRLKGQLYRGGDFGGKIARVAYRLSGRFVTPHLLRSIYAVHAMETLGDRATLGSLAEAMGHKLETLEKIYDKRRSERKTRLIEAALAPQLDRICAGLPVSVKMPNQEPMQDLEKLRAAINQLPPHQRRLLVEVL